MKLAVYMSLLFLAMTSHFALGANDRVPQRSTQYKCHLLMQDQSELVNYMMSKDNYAKTLQRKLAGSFIYAKDGVSKRMINKAFECVEAHQDFSSMQARALDEQTLH